MDNRRKADRRRQDKLLTDGEAADLARVPLYTVKYWRQTGVLPFVKMGKHPRIWLSVFQKVFQKPSDLDSLEIADSLVECRPLRTLGGHHGQA